MKKYTQAIAKWAVVCSIIITQLLTTGCSTTGVSDWWNSPATQKGVAIVGSVIISSAEAMALNAFQQWIGGGSVDLQQINKAGGTMAFYTTANAIRQLQGTPQVMDVMATTTAIQQSGMAYQDSQKLAQQLFDNAVAAMHKYPITPDQAVELNAVALDGAALKVATAK